MNAPILHKNVTLISFEDGDETIKVRLTEDFVGNYWAVDTANPDLAIGFGLSSIGAIADLFEKLPRAASEREERDDLAAKWDRARDYAKETVA